MVAMVLLAATCALKPFRFGKIQTMVIAGLSGGFGFFVLVELSRKLGMSGYYNSGGGSVGANCHWQFIGIDDLAASGGRLTHEI